MPGPDYVPDSKRLDDLTTLREELFPSTLTAEQIAERRAADRRLNDLAKHIANPPGKP